MSAHHPTKPPGATAQRVVLYVFDGLMEEQADDTALMPRLAAFRAAAARMRQHRPIFPSVTRGNAAAIATGCFPGTNGLHANNSLLAGISRDRSLEATMESLSRLHHTTGAALLTPSMGAILAEHGLQYWGIGSWTNGCAAVHHPPADASCTAPTGAALHPDFSLPEDANTAAAERFGPWPPSDPATDFENGLLQMEYALQVASQWIIPDMDPAVLTLWTCEPDHVSLA